MSDQKKKMFHECSCEWCTTPTQLKENYAIKLPAYIRFGQGKNSETSIIACMTSISGEDASVTFPDGTKFNNLTSAGRYAHTELLRKTTSEGNNGWKRWRINMKFLDGSEKPVVLKTLKEAKVSIENGSLEFSHLNFKSKLCRCSNEKIASKTILSLLMKQPVSIKRKQMNHVVSKLVKKPKTDEDYYMLDENTENICESQSEDDDIDLDSFLIDVTKVPGNKYYNDIVYGRKYVQFSNISVDEEDQNFFICTVRDKFINVRIPKCVMFALYQYRSCGVLERFRTHS
tara:strand:- start:2239 stop:3099 length:861 start_codon:yes stop_codon:yes gene_type:complete